MTPSLLEAHAVESESELKEKSVFIGASVADRFAENVHTLTAIAVMSESVRELGVVRVVSIEGEKGHFVAGQTRELFGRKWVWKGSVSWLSNM